MQIEIFNIPMFVDHSQIDEMNKFLRSHHIIDIERHMVSSGANPFWTFCIRYTEGENYSDQYKKQKIDYREVLDEETFERFSLLRELRRGIADNKGIPVYAVFTNEELANIAKLPEITIANIRNIEGIGIKKAEKYGETLVELFNNGKK
jgi:superfamily II DNA helicase RecQ